ncbi:MAG: 4Fe-4S dicluster domain-containing protein [Candidatus Freyarchaeota archaeon]|nr:4Fe-4S dicluster domain-containing protein [Candidatus Freyrarchaeum guaymaensis]
MVTFRSEREAVFKEDQVEPNRFTAFRTEINRRRILVDPYKCTACMICMVTCAAKHHGSLNPKKAKIRVENRLPVVKVWFLESCDGCESLGVRVPFCVQHCPKGALRVG